MTKWGTKGENLFSFCIVVLPVLHVGAARTTKATKPTTSQTTSSQDCPAKPYCRTQLVINNCHKYVSKSPWIQHHTLPHYQAPAPAASWPPHAGGTPCTPLCPLPAPPLHGRAQPEHRWHGTRRGRAALTRSTGIQRPSAVLIAGL